MKQPEYIVPESADEAVGALARCGPDGSILAGGTDLLIEFRRREQAGILHPAFSSGKRGPVIDISRLGRELGCIGESGGMISVGPLVTHARLARSPLLLRAAPLLPIAASTVGSPQVRNRGTVGGNIMNAAACADTVPPLVALGASVVLRSEATGRRVVGLADFFVKPYQTLARADELLVGVEFPRASGQDDMRSAFIKLGRRNALSISRLSVAVVLFFDRQGRIRDARIVPGAAFPTWQRVAQAEEMLIGEMPSEKLFDAAGLKVAEIMVACTGKRWSTPYKEPVLAVLVRRALGQAAAAQPPSAPGERAELHGLNGGNRSPVFPHPPAGGKELREESPAPGALPLPAGGGIPDTARLPGEIIIRTTINGRIHAVAVSARQTLLELLRDRLGLTGTKCGCEVGECGACTVLLDGEPVNSCLVPAPQADGKSVATVEGLMKDNRLAPLQESFLDHDAVHCGFCTPGMLMSADALLRENPRPGEQEIRTAISGNLCRCTGYVQIVEAIKDVPEKPVPRNAGGPHAG